MGVNYRVAPQDSIGKVMHNIVSYVKPVAKKYGVLIKAFEADDEYAEYVAAAEEDFAVVETAESIVEPLYKVDYNATLVLTASQKTQVAPVSPSVDDAVWDVFSGTIQHAFAFEDGKVVPVGELMTGNTDTRHYLGILPFLPVLCEKHMRLTLHSQRSYPQRLPLVPNPPGRQRRCPYD